MNTTIGIVLALSTGAVLLAQQPEYTSDGQLVRPANYREWIYLSSGLGMTYSNGPSDSSFFDNVFVSPDAYHAFQATGKWPDKTMLVLEVRAAGSHSSINKAGHFQSDLAGLQVELKDEKRFPEKWAFFGFGGPPGSPAATGRKIPAGSACQSCHGPNRAVDNTFVQFYPTLLPVAEAKHTLRASYEPPTPSPVKFYQIVAEQGWPAAAKIFQESKARDPEASLFKESSLNRLGYQLMSAGKKSEAVAVMELMVSSYPKSANAYDSLAEICERAGENQKSMAASKKALDLLASDPTLVEERRAVIRKNVEARLSKINAAP